MKTILCDIDGCILKHLGSLGEILTNPRDGYSVVLEGSIEKLNEWQAKGYIVVLTTGRTEAMRSFTEEQLRKLGLPYDRLIMGLKNYPRVLINDNKPGRDIVTAEAYMLERNEVIGSLDI